MDKGVGLACLHYAVESPKDKGGPEFLKWIGGYYETGFSTNPHWDADFKQLPKHPTMRGVEPFAIRDEWYYNIRFPEGSSVVQPLLEAVPPDASRGTAAAKEHPGRTELVSWRSSGPMEDGVSVLPAATSTRIGATTISASSCLTRCCGPPKSKCRPSGVDSEVTSEDLREISIRRNKRPWLPQAGSLRHDSDSELAQHQVKNVGVGQSLADQDARLGSDDHAALCVVAGRGAVRARTSVASSGMPRVAGSKNSSTGS